MKITRKLLAGLLCLALLICCLPGVFAAEVADATIDYTAKCSLTIYKYDMTNAEKDGVWNSDSFATTGWRETYVEDTLGNAVRKENPADPSATTSSGLGNGQTSNGYAIKGVEFSYLRVADLVTYAEVTDGRAQIRNLYGFNKTNAADLLAAIGLADGAGRFEPADSSDKLDHANYYYTSDTLNKALYDALEANATTVKDALETYIARQAETKAMPLTDNNGRSIVRDLSVGLYLLVETKVPEMVTSTTNPFFVSLPMTAVSGDDNSASPEGGHCWNYDIVVYPKNSTGIPSLTKEVRESVKDTGKNDGSDTITDDFAHNATGSAGDTMEYQIISTLPTITSNATSLSVYNFYDTISNGLSYNKTDGVRIEIFTDKDCTDKVASWDLDSGKFGVSYSSDDRHMTVDISKAGLDEINGRTENVNGNVYMGYSNYTVRLTYTATVNSDATVIYGENGNENEVVLTWKRTSGDFYDTLISDAHVYSFGIDLTKVFSDKDSETAEETGMFKHVKFRIYNATDGYWVTASRNDAEGVYYVTGHAAEEADATVFYPVTSEDKNGKIIVKGLEDDEYVLTEIETANGYVLLKDAIHVVITAADDAARPCTAYTKDVLGVLQNDPHYAFDGGFDLHLAGIPQVPLTHNYLTASATVDGNAVEMRTDNGSANAAAQLQVVNTPGFDLPQTGDSGTWLYSAAGIFLMAGAMLVILLAIRRKKHC